MDLPNERALAQLLEKRKCELKKTFPQLHREIQQHVQLRISTITAWHRAVAFPSPDKLEAISRAYQVSLEELEAAFREAKDARQAFVEGRREAPRRAHSYEELEGAYGSISDRVSLRRTNTQLPTLSRGRKG
jgi:transcriptional regulator with XRE-family HTH domain